MRRAAVRLAWFSRRACEHVFRTALFLFVASAVLRAQAPQQYMPNEILVRLKGGVSRPEMNAMNSATGVTVLQYVEKLDLYRLRIPNTYTVPEMIELYRRDTRVEYAEPNYVGSGGDFVPSDTFFQGQWYLNNAGQTGGKIDADIDAVQGWQVTKGNSSVVVAVLDTGIDFGHPEFAGRLLQGFDFVNNDSDAQADHPHGVEVSGILAANSDNNFGIAGIAQSVKLLPVKVLNSNNLGTTLNLAQGLIFAAENRAQVISMSLINYPTNSPVLNSALKFARDSGSILIACAGNGGIGNANVSGPGASPLTISVGATDQNDQRASFSGTGAALGVVAPGVNLLTIGLNRSDVAVTFSGCSAATPVVSGIAAVLLSLDQILTHDDVRKILTESAEDLVGGVSEDTPGRDDFFGHGRVNMNDAITLALRDTVNNYVKFESMQSTFKTTPDTSGCPAGFSGKFSFQAQLTNISSATLSNLSAEVGVLTSENLLLRPKGDPDGVGARLPVPKSDDDSDGTLGPGETVRVPFVICLKRMEPFQFFVNVLGATH